MERRNLRKAREEKGWSQEEFAAHFAQMQREAISLWETGKSNPYDRNRREAANLLGWSGSLDELFALVEDEVREEEEHLPIHIPATVQTFIASGLERRLWHIAHTNYSHPSEMTPAIQQAIEEFDIMGNTPFEITITRREALCSLASLPMTTLGQKPTLHARRYEEMIMRCTAALEACWQLYRGSDPIGTQHAFECVSTYVPLLETIARDSSQYHKEALDLATRYALLQTLLGWSCVGAIGTVPIAQEAMSLSKASGDILLHLSACTKLGWAYSAARKSIQAHETMQEGEQVLKGYQRKKKVQALSPRVIGNFNSTYALVQAKNGIDPDTALGIATNSDTGNDHYAFIVFTESAQWLEAAHTCSFKGDPEQAIQWIGKRIDMETLAPRPDVPQSERGRIETINVMMRALLQSKERDMYQIIDVWKVGMEGAQSLRNEQRYNEAIANFEIMQALYPGERAIMKLIPLTAHW